MRGKDQQGQGRRDAEGEGGSLLDWDPSILVHLQLQLRVPGKASTRVRDWTVRLNPQGSPEYPQAHAFRRKVFREAF